MTEEERRRAYPPVKLPSVKITVVRTLKPEEAIGTDKTNRPEEFGVCPLFKVGDEYIMRNLLIFLQIKKERTGHVLGPLPTYTGILYM